MVPERRAEHQWLERCRRVEPLEETATENAVVDDRAAEQ